MRVLLLSILLSPALCHAQFSVPWFKVAGGGGSSQNAGWRVTGTIGQTEAELVPLCSGDGTTPGLCAGASYRLVGGFWAGIPPRGPHPSCGASLQCIFRDGFEQPG